ncbi:efflux RND transporter permease subunit [Alteromonas lipolytica]|uniref:Acriflavin resistance protein n=1 Tax=Alteromonas lipolytica TaxID=1856405 RepID=A0A1E8FEN6_9ALTE|nr:efflux RND transporter permease subunit [Alteromonas lipolytica]OFI34394.1 acriflavin resistance protein [Alteromonas lipolytica]GGF81837.1 multidrug resistance protein [Alteromonas lipolytica]
MKDPLDTQTGMIAWFARNPVAANLLMLFILVMGLVSYFTIQRQMFPNIEINYINISASYLGASPQEIEESILIKIEENLKDVSEIKRMISRSFRNNGRISLEIDQDAELPEILDKVKLRVDSIATFPSGMEPVTISQVEFQQDVIEMALTGDIPLTELKPIANEIEDELLQVGTISIANARVPLDEIAIEIKPELLRMYGLTIADVSAAINQYSANISAGQLRTDAGLVSVRIESQFYDGEEFASIPVKIGADGAQVLLSDIADIKDEFTEGERYFRFSGKNAVIIDIKATKFQNIIPVAQTVKAYMEHKNSELPAGLELKELYDMTYYLNARLNMMLQNLLQGSILVALMLTIFLRFRLAFWVMVGLPLCFLGAVMLMPVFGVSINILSLFAFIMVLGIVVDDAIVIGESAYSEIERKGTGIDNVIRGAKRVATPATFGVLTTIAVFAPFILSSGPDSAFFYNIAVVVSLCLVFSLIESKLILPAHVAGIHFKPVKPTSWRAKFNNRFNQFVNGPYYRTVSKAIEWRWSVLMLFISLLLLGVGLIQGNFVRMIPQPKAPHDFPMIEIEMNENVSDFATIEALKTIENTIRKVEAQTIEEFGSGMLRDIVSFNETRSEARIVAPLVDEEARHFSTFELSRRWREAMPVIAGMKSITIIDDINQSGDNGEFAYLLYGADINMLNEAGRRFIQLLQDQKGVYDISSSIDPSSKEIRMSLLPAAYELDLSLRDIANQVGFSFYGGEAQRVIRNGEEVRVMVRYPRMTREQFSALKYTIISTPASEEVMLGDVVELTEQPGISYIRREDGYRSVYVFGSIDEEAVEPNELVENIDENLLPQLLEEFPQVQTQLGGDIEEQQAQQDEQVMFFAAAMIIIYILLAVPLKSYGQPIIIMSVIPFSMTGAIYAHFLLDLELSMFSTFGLIAAAGVVINDSLVMTDYINQRRAEGYSILEAAQQAGSARFRAITLTSITTFAGVTPLLFETSLQAQFVIPMAAALGSAVLYATLVTLILVPCLYLILQDIGIAGKTVFNVIVTRITALKRKPSQAS